MFNYFHQHKSNYEKGQLAPFFILMLVILIVMVLVTVNLSKVAFIKTDASNSVDAGALAAGSVMANTFNSVAKANSTMEATYWEFFATVSFSFAMALQYLIRAHIFAVKAKGFATAAQAEGIAALTDGGAALAGVASPCSAEPKALFAEGAAGVAIGKMGLAITNVGLAIAKMGMFVTYSWGILLAISAYTAAQDYFFGIICRTAYQGWLSSRTIGYKFAFMNSGIGAKLKEGKPLEEEEPEEEEDEEEQEEEQHNFRDSFSDFLKEIKKETVENNYRYNWLDGQQRRHSVEFTNRIQPPDTFKLTVAALPYPAEAGLLAVILTTAKAVKAKLASLIAPMGPYSNALKGYTKAMVKYGVASGFLAAACACLGCLPWCAGCVAKNIAKAAITLGIGVGLNTVANLNNGIGLGLNIAAFTSMIPLYPELATAWGGLAPAPWGIEVKSKEGEIPLEIIPFIPCWIDELKHDRLVRLETIQRHEGRVFGALWEARYPGADSNYPEPEKRENNLKSYSLVNFSGKGKIHPPVLRFDPSIIETDGSRQRYNPCLLVRSRISQLEREIQELENCAFNTEQQADTLESNLSGLEQIEAARLTETIRGLRQDAQNYRQAMEQKQTEIETINSTPEYSQCF
jgi:hypothetical protein